LFAYKILRFKSRAVFRSSPTSHNSVATLESQEKQPLSRKNVNFPISDQIAFTFEFAVRLVQLVRLCREKCYR